MDDQAINSQNYTMLRLFNQYRNKPRVKKTVDLFSLKGIYIGDAVDVLLQWDDHNNMRITIRGLQMDRLIMKGLAIRKIINKSNSPKGE